MCLGCNLVSGKMEVYSLQKTKLFSVILDHDPINSGHILIIPKRHIESYVKLNKKELEESKKIIKKWQTILGKKLQIKNFTIMMNEGGINDLNGHLHIHVIPRFEVDRVSLTNSIIPTLPIKKVFKKLNS